MPSLIVHTDRFRLILTLFGTEGDIFIPFSFLDQGVLSICFELTRKSRRMSQLRSNFLVDSLFWIGPFQLNFYQNFSNFFGSESCNQSDYFVPPAQLIKFIPKEVKLNMCI